MEDHVSMGVHAAHKLAAVVTNTRNVLAIESLCAAQGLDLLGLTSSVAVEAARRVVREHVPKLEADRPLAPDISTMRDVISRDLLATAVRHAAGEIE
jgi:histidine ammonia-lyase